MAFAGHFVRWHADPSKPLKQMQVPVVRSQVPALEHS